VEEEAVEKEAVEEEALARDNAGWEAASAVRSRADDACSTARRSAQRVPAQRVAYTRL
jgi:hypothetical protein